VTAWVKPAEGGAELSVHIQPGASKSEIAGLHGDSLKIRVRARPVEGAANTALTEFVATCLGLPRKAVRILRGEKSREKSVWVALQADEVVRRIKVNSVGNSE
jgi:uncharacterized protein (TIGR00251 family)